MARGQQKEYDASRHPPAGATDAGAGSGAGARRTRTAAFGGQCKEMLDKQYKTAITQGTALILSVLLCFAVGADFYAVLNVQFTLPWVGCLLTGIFASRGANFVSDLFKKLQTLGDNPQ